MAKPTKVYAVGVAAGSLREEGKARSAKIADAMRDAVITAQAEGITDPAVIRERIQDARVKAKQG